MDVIKRYPTLDELVASITRLVNNLDKMTEIMTTTSITMNPEKAKAVLNEWYGNMVMDEVSKKFWAENEKGKLRDDIQDLKLENDRLALRNDKMLQVIRSIACDPDCEFCSLRGSDCTGKDMELLAKKTLKELEDL